VVKSISELPVESSQRELGVRKENLMVEAIKRVRAIDHDYVYAPDRVALESQVCAFLIVLDEHDDDIAFMQAYEQGKIR